MRCCWKNIRDRHRVALLIGLLLMQGIASQPLRAQDENTNASEAETTTQTNTDSANESGEQVVDSASALGRREEKEVTVGTNDTFISISLAEFGTIGMWRLIAEYNKLDVSKPLFYGQSLYIPRLSFRPIEYAEVIYAHGKNQLNSHQNGQERALQRSNKIFLNDVVRTGPAGFASILFRSGAVVNLQPSSQVKLINLSCLATDENCFIELKTVGGDMRVDVPANDDQKNRFKVTTPHASAAVRGTSFDVSAIDATFLLGVTDGDVAAQAGDESLDLARGFGVVAEPGKALPEPIALLPAADFNALPVRLAKGDRVSIKAVDEATSYSWALTVDVTGNQVLNKANDTQTSYEIGVSERGTYYVQVRAIDNNSLKGFVSTQAIKVIGVDESFDPIELSATQINQDLLLDVTLLDPAIAGYEVQISETEDFIDPVSLDIGVQGQLIFSQQPSTVFARARGLLTPNLVTPFGPAISVQ